MGTDPLLAVALGLIAAGVALYGARLAARSAAERQDKQLKHDTARQVEELKHDRKTSELVELRGVLDDAARDITNAERAMLDATDAWVEDGTVSDRRRTDMREAMDAMWGSAQRIRIRIGSEKAREAYSTATEAQLQLLGMVVSDDAAQDADARRKAVQGPIESFLEQRDAFFEEAHRKYGSKGLGGD